MGDYPKMVYLHPVDKTQEHRFLVVNSCEEEEDALGKGYKLEPHIPQPLPAAQYEDILYEGKTEETPTGNLVDNGMGEAADPAKEAGEKQHENAVDAKHEELHEN